MNNEQMYAEINRLRKELDDLGSKFVAMKRHYEDLLNNLDEDNFSANYKVQQGNKFSKIEQTAEKVAAVVADIEENVKQSISEIEATAKDISFKVGTYWYAVVNVDVNPEDIGNRGALSKYTDSLITYNNQNYYYNDITDKWQKTDSDSITSQFLQTANGFKLNGDVLIDGNTFVNGEFSTAVENSINVKIVGGSIIFYTEGNDLFKLERTDAGYMQMYIRDGWKLGFSGEFDFSAANVTGLYAVFE
jgi:hypothetical protein